MVESYISVTQEDALRLDCRDNYQGNWNAMLAELKERRNQVQYVRRQKIIDSDIAFIEHMLATRTS